MRNKKAYIKKGYTKGVIRSRKS